MQRLRVFLANWLGFSRTEVNGFLVLIPVLILLVMSEPAYRSWLAHQEKDFSRDQKLLDSLTAHWGSKDDKKHAVEKNILVTSLFDFNPNTASETELLNLGFPKNLSTRIANYRQKGGVFRIKRDLLKIYGMDSTLYDQLYTHILLPDELVPDKLSENKIESVAYTERQKNTFVPFDINKADTAQLKRINGIGNVLATRIVSFRDGLGGFIDPAQISEVYGLDSAVVQKLKRASYIEDNFEPRKLNINTVDEKSLVSHPYIKKSIAKAILAYRFQHGNFKDVRDLTKVALIPSHEAERLIPYLKVED
jgi:competence protein ComEA